MHNNIWRNPVGMSTVQFIFFALWGVVSSFNIDTRHPIVYEDPSNEPRSYFGYSLVLSPGSKAAASWIQIGAPRVSSYSVNLKSNIRTGGVFKCSVGEKCSPISFDTDRIGNLLPFSIYGSRANGSWIGASMDINYNHSRVVTCGPRWTLVSKNDRGGTRDFLMEGSCYWWHASDDSPHLLLPLFGSNNEIYTDPLSENSVYYYGQGESGFSVHMPSSKAEMLIGAPGVYNWDGTSILYKDSPNESPIASRLRFRRQAFSSNEFADKNIANTRLTPETSAYDLLGYSVTSGYFYSKTKLLYVTSAPRSNEYLGQVLIHNFYRGNDLAMNVKEKRQGEQFGEYFGGSVTAGDINNDGYDDLIVGSPFYLGQSYNEGRISVFLGNSTGRLHNPDVGKSITGKSANGQFGSCVQYLGDLNLDNFGGNKTGVVGPPIIYLNEDIAVAAPYEEENSGVVYIFRGTAAGLDVNPCQRIVGKDIFSTIRGFGASISRAIDTDFNMYRDLAVGAHLSGNAVVLRSSPVATVHHSLTSDIQQLDYEQRSFTVTECIWFQPYKMVDRIDVSMVLTIDDQLNRATLQNAQDSRNITNVTLVEKQTHCQMMTVTLNTKFSNRYDPITLSLSHTFLPERKVRSTKVISGDVTGEDNFCPRCAVYDKYGSSQTSSIMVSFSRGCGPDNICVSFLQVDVEFVGIGDNDTYVLGSEEYIGLDITVRNSGEKAYLTRVIVALPPAVSLRLVPSICSSLSSDNNTLISCPVDDPLKENSGKPIERLDLNMKKVNTGNYGDELRISVDVLTNSENGNRNNSMVNSSIKLLREADMIITGKPGEQSTSYGNITYGRPNFTQSYQVQKVGVSPIDEILIEIEIPRATKNKKGELTTFISLYPPMVFLAGQPVSCTPGDFVYIVTENKAEESDVGISDRMNSGNESVLTAKRRVVRSAEDTEVLDGQGNFTQNSSRLVAEEDDVELMGNRTFYINCSMPEIQCSKLTCKAGPFRAKQDIAFVDLKMLFDIPAIQDVLGKKDIVVLSTRGSLTITRPPNFVQNGDGKDSATISSLFIGQREKGRVATWIIIISAIAGLLLVLLLILGLIKAGFFRRSKKEELENLKAEFEYEKHQADNMDNGETQMEPEDMFQILDDGSDVDLKT